MPSANDQPIPNFFDDDDTIAAPLNGHSTPEQEIFAFAPSIPPPSSKKSKKKSKKNANKAQVKTCTEGDDSSPYEAEVTVKDDRVKLGESPSKEDHAPPPAEDNGAFYEELLDVDPAPPPVHAPPSAAPVKSPRPAHARPVQQTTRTPPSRPASSYSPPQQYNNLAGYRAHSSTPNARPISRRESGTHTSPRPRFVEPVAPPHRAQPHFYGLPDFGLNFGPQKMDPASGGKVAGSDGYCCTFDSFADSGDAVSAKRARDALLVGSEGGLEVYRVLPNKFEVVGRLEGLRGSVIGARVLPQVGREDAVRRMRPLVAVVVHGAMGGEGRDERDEEELPGYYQTSVEVYSLQEQQHVATLYRSPPVAAEKPTLGHLATIPGPVGDLNVHAEGKCVVVASGKSGEVFVFSSAATVENPDEHFRCLGKFWTSLQTLPATAASRPQSSSEGGLNVEEKEERPGVPLLSLSPRWLAIVAPSTSAHVSIGGSPSILESNPSPPGLASHVAPPQPPISCDIAGVDAEGTWSRLTWQAAQGLVKYGAIGFEMGKQGWRELTNPAPPASAGQSTRGGSREHDGAFPPTMAPMDDPSRIVKEPAIVSIIDLDSLLEAEEVKPKYAPLPLSAFALQEGCNFLSLSSNGLRLLSVSRSGKVSTIWDLAQCCHGISITGLSAGNDDAAQGPCVKQLHRFDRASESLVTAAAWSRDDDMLAVLTLHGTVHLHEVPARPSRKRKRRSTSTTASPGPEKAQPTVGVSQGMSPPSGSVGWMGSFRAGLQSVSSQVNTVRAQSSMPSFAGLRGMTATAGQAGGRAIARGLSQGFTAAKGGVGDVWHADENKIKHTALREVVHGEGVLRWIRRQGDVCVAVVCGGEVHLHPVEPFTRMRGDVLVTGLKHDKFGRKTFTLPGIRTAVEGGKRERDPCAAEGVHGFWSLRIVGDEPSGNARVNAEVPCEQAHEIETNPPFVPFHVDSRVSIFAFDDAASLENSQADLLRPSASPPNEAATLFHSQGHGQDEAPWLFGAPLPSGRRVNVRDEREGLEWEGGMEDSEEELGRQVVSRLTLDGDGEGSVRVNTRVRNGGAEGFEDEDREVL